jgi:para-nitrobenzyl esterase
MTLATTSTGTVRGAVTTIEGQDVSCFLGIPYAPPPVGKRPFLPPVPATGWTGIRDCAVPGPGAPQNPEPGRTAER